MKNKPNQNVLIILVVIIGIIFLGPKLGLFSTISTINVDQSQTECDGSWDVPTAQSFKPTATTISSIEVYFRTASTSSATVRLYSSPAKTTLLASKSMSATEGWNNFIFPAFITVTPGQTYYFEVDPSGGDTCSKYQNPYTKGIMYYNFGSGYQEHSNFDIGFQTHFSDGTTPPQCTADNTCAVSTCTGQTCTNNCGTTISGTKNCGGTCLTLAGLINYGNQWVSGTITMSQLINYANQWVSCN